MLLKIELPTDCELFINSFDIDELVKEISPVKILGVMQEDESNDLKNSLARVELRIRQTTKSL